MIISYKKILLAVIAADITVISMALIVGEASKHFDEAGFVTCFSFCQLLIIAALSREVFVVRKGEARARTWKTPFTIWSIMAIAFIFLSIDEIAMVHEYADVLIHNIFAIQEVGLTDRIDDILVGCYGLLGLMGFYIYREEMKKYREAFPLFVAGFILMFVMVGLDILTNKKDILRLFISNLSVLNSFHYWLSIIEDMFKIIAEGIFIGAFYRCLEIARRISKVS